MPIATVDHSQRNCEVWACNLEKEMKKICQVIRKYNYVAMDTEFPGVVARPIGEFRSNADYQYQLLPCNVDLLKIIQRGLTFMNEPGEYPLGTSTWQFNFRLNLTEDMYAQDSIELLTSGIQFKKHEEEGIETQYFAELLMTSGVVLCEGVKWLSFHSGYDFGYLIKILTNSNLPEEELDFFEILRLFFPVIYDVKYLMKSCKNLKGGLQEVAEQLELDHHIRQDLIHCLQEWPFSKREKCSLKIILMMPNIAVICIALVLVHPMYRMTQGMHMKRKPTSRRDMK